jgi:uncharacterized membrane protein
MTGFIVTDLLLYLYIVALPGYVLTDLYLGGSDPLEKAIVGLTLGIFLVPVLSFGAAILLSTNVNASLLFSLATLLWIGPLSFRRWQAKRA